MMIVLGLLGALIGVAVLYWVLVMMFFYQDSEA